MNKFKNGKNKQAMTERKKILYVENCADGTVGGSFLFMYDLATHLNRDEFIPIACFHRENIVAEWFRNVGIETHVFQRPKPINFQKIIGSATGIKKAFLAFLSPVQKVMNLFIQLVLVGIMRARFLRNHKIDLIDLNNSITRNHDWMLAALLARVKCVTHEAGINKRFSWLSRYFHKRIDAIICCSKAIFDNMLVREMKHPCMPIIHSCIAPERLQIKENPKEVRQRIGIGGAWPIIGVVGNIKEWKGQETVVRATGILFKRWEGIKCLLVGGYESDGAYYKKLLTLVKDLGISENVVFTGFQKNPIDFLNIMDVVVHSSIEPEPFGMVNLEAMSLKKPVVATNIGGPLEIFENNVSGILVAPSNAEILAQAIANLLSDSQRATDIGEEGFNRFCERFSFENTVKTTQEVYREIFINRGEKDKEVL